MGGADFRGVDIKYSGILTMYRREFGIEGAPAMWEATSPTGAA